MTGAVNARIPRTTSQGAWRVTLVISGLALGLWGLGSESVLAQGITREEALAQIFPDAAIRAERVFLTEAQLDQVTKRAGTASPSALVARYVASRESREVGRAYVDTHTVRTKRESLLISLDSLGRVLRVDVTAFLEPVEYRAPEQWLGQYRGRELGDALAINRAIRPIAGATLTARATNSAIRRVLVIDEILRTGGDNR